jgi:hypothetical protein
MLPLCDRPELPRKWQRGEAYRFTLSAPGYFVTASRQINGRASLRMVRPAWKSLQKPSPVGRQPDASWRYPGQGRG